MDPALLAKQRDFEAQKSRTKLALNICTICGNKDARACQGCGTTAYCSTVCQRIDWRDRGHRAACKKIQTERAAEAARAEAPTPPKEIFYGPAPRSHADEVRARIAAEHEAARERREANPEPEPASERFGSRCPICMEEWDVNVGSIFRECCCRTICRSCEDKISGNDPCPLCRAPPAGSDARMLARLRQHVENEQPEAIKELGDVYLCGKLGVVKSSKKAAKIYKRAVELGNLDAMVNLGAMHGVGNGVKLDKEKATQLYRMAAARGHAIAQTNLGEHLLNDGRLEEGFEMFMLSAEQGYTQSEFYVGIMIMEKGEGVPANREEARRWWERAAAKGHEGAIECLAHLEQLA